MALAMARPWKNPKTGVYWLELRDPAEAAARCCPGGARAALCQYARFHAFFRFVHSEAPLVSAVGCSVGVFARLYH